MGNISVDYDVLNQKGSPAWYSDLFANIPTPGYKGRMFISIDTFAFYRDNGVGWDLVGGPGTGTITGAGVFGQVTFFSGTDTISGNTDFVWDNTNKRLGINTGTPGAPLDIHSTGTAAQFNGTTTNNAFVLFQNAGTSKWRIGNLYNAGANDYQIFDVLNSTARLTIKNTGASTLIGTFTATSLIKSGGTSSQILLADGTTTPTSTFGAGSVTSVSALTLGTSGTDLTSSVANSTTTPVITLNVPTASATNRGALSSADWTIFNSKQSTITLTTTGTSGAATLVGATLNIPNYTNVGTVTSVAALTLGTTGTDLSSSVANSTSTPVITLNVPTASATNRGALSSADFTTFNNKQATISVTAPVVLTGATISMPAATTSVNGYLTSTDWNTFNNKTSNLGTVTDVVALTIGTTGIDITSTAVTTTTTPVITLNIPTASASNRGALSSTDWTTFNNKQATLSLTTTGTSGAATLVANTLNVPNYGSGAVTGSGTTNYIPKFTSASAIGNSVAYDNGSQIGISQTTLFTKFSVADSLAATSVGSNFNPGIVNIQNTNTTNGNLSLIGFQDASAFINLAAFGAINEVHSASPNNVKGSLAFYTKNSGTSYVTEKMRLDASGNLGLGVTPSAWGTGRTAIQLKGSSTAVYFAGEGNTVLSNNYYYNAGDKYIDNGFSTQYLQGASGQHAWYNAPNNTSGAGAAITFTQAMTLDASGNLGIGITTPDIFSRGDARNVGISVSSASDNMALQLNAGASAGRGAQIYMGQGSTRHFTISSNVSETRVGTTTSTPLILTTNDTTKLTIASTGEATFSGDVIRTSSNVGGINEIAVINTATSGASSSRVRISTAYNSGTTLGDALTQYTDNNNFNWATGSGVTTSRDYVITNYFTLGTNVVLRLAASTGAATFSSTLGIGGVADNIKAGTYQPTLTAVLNYASGSGNICTFSRIANIVTVFFDINVNATAVLSKTECYISLPIASSFTTFVGVGSGVGDISSNYIPVLAAYGGGTNIVISFYSPATSGTYVYRGSFSYEVT